MDLRELLKTPATQEAPEQQLSRVLAMLKAAYAFPYGQAVIAVPHELHKAYADHLHNKPGFITFAKGHTLTFAGMPLVPHDDAHITVVSHAARTRHWTYANDPMHARD